VNRDIRRLAFSTFAGAWLALLMLFGGGFGAAAARSALPGETLYGVKTSFEQARLGLVGSAAGRARLRLEFASQRLSDLNALIAAGRYQQTSAAALEFERLLNQASAEREKISSTDPAIAAELALQLSEALAGSARALRGMLAGAPVAVRQQLSRALAAVEQLEAVNRSHAGEIELLGKVEAIGGSRWTVGGKTVIVPALAELPGTIQLGDLVHLRAMPDRAGQLVVRAVEYAGGSEVTRDGAAPRAAGFGSTARFERGLRSTGCPGSSLQDSG
jgi:hypothetical protein